MLRPGQVLVDMVFSEGQQFAPQLHSYFVGGASQLLVHSTVHGTCKLFCPPPFMLLIVLYNSVKYNYIIIMQWLVGWFRDQGKKGVCVGKEVDCGPMVVALCNVTLLQL